MGNDRWYLAQIGNDVGNVAVAQMAQAATHCQAHITPCDRPRVMAFLQKLFEFLIAPATQPGRVVSEVGGLPAADKRAAQVLLRQLRHEDPAWCVTRTAMPERLDQIAPAFCRLTVCRFLACRVSFLQVQHVPGNHGWPYEREAQIGRAHFMVDRRHALQIGVER